MPRILLRNVLCVCPLIDDKLRHNVVKEAVEPHDVNFFFAITRPQNGQMPEINEGKRRRKLGLNKEK